MDIFVSGVGNRGTITGVSRYFKQVATRPSSPWRWSRRPAHPDPRPVQAKHSSPDRTRSRASVRALPDVLDLSLVDAVEQVTNEEAVDFAPGFGRRTSCRASPAVRRRRCGTSGQAPGQRGQDHRVVLPIRASATQAPSLFDGVFDAAGLPT